MSILERVRPALLDLPRPHEEYGVPVGRLRLHANENAFASDALALYPDAQAREAERALASLYGVAPANVVVSRGSDESIDLLVRAFCIPERDAVCVFPPTFGMYAHAARLQGARLISVPPSDGALRVTRERLLADEARAAKVVFVCSPANPTGELVPHEDVRALLEARRDQIVVVDEAYVEFSSAGSVAAWLAAYPNLVVLRTLSKARGLAGARVGAALLDAKVADVLRRMRAPYALTTASLDLAIGAASPAAQESVAAHVAATRHERERLFGELSRHASVLRVWPSQANFHLVHFREPLDAFERIAQANILVRTFANAPLLRDCARITVGTPRDNDRLLASLSNP